MSLVEQVKNSGLVTPDLFNMKTGGKIAPIIPRTFTDILNMSEVFFKSGMAPKTLDSGSKIAVAIQYGMELGLPPVQAMQNIAVVNGRPCLWGDALPALMYKHGHKLDESIDGEGDSMIATCKLTRGDTGHVIVGSFSMKQAKKAGLLHKKGVWQTYPERMLQMRARGFSVRDGAPDAMVGLAVAEEVQDYEPATQAPKNITPPSPPPAPPTQIEPENSDEVEGAQTNEAILEDLEQQLSTASDMDTINEIWVEFEGAHESENPELVEVAKELYATHKERVEVNA